MRFGCGARIPVHVLGDICEACVRAGFVRPLPAPAPAPVIVPSQNRSWMYMQRRAAEHPYPRPQESLVVRAVSRILDA